MSAEEVRDAAIDAASREHAAQEWLGTQRALAAAANLLRSKASWDAAVSSIADGTSPHVESVGEADSQAPGAAFDAAQHGWVLTQGSMDPVGGRAVRPAAVMTYLSEPWRSASGRPATTEALPPSEVLRLVASRRPGLPGRDARSPQASQPLPSPPRADRRGSDPGSASATRLLSRFNGSTAVVRAAAGGLGSSIPPIRVEMQPRAVPATAAAAAPTPYSASRARPLSASATSRLGLSALLTGDAAPAPAPAPDSARARTPSAAPRSAPAAAAARNAAAWQWPTPQSTVVPTATWVSGLRSSRQLTTPAQRERRRQAQLDAQLEAQHAALHEAWLAEQGRLDALREQQALERRLQEERLESMRAEQVAHER